MAQLRGVLSLMSRRQQESWRRRSWTLLQLSGIGLLVAGAVTLGLTVSAGAAPPSSGSIVLDSAQAVAPFTGGAPFSSGQSINVVIPANSAFAGSAAAINIVECAAPNGVVPTDVTECDGNTIQGNTILPNADGSFTYTGYELFALPDLNFEDSTGPACGETAATECILYIGNDQNDFTQPHLWSQPFFIQSNNGVDSGDNPGDGSAPPVATTPSPTLSTAVASPPTATADGVDLSTVTVTLLGGTGTGVPVAGKAVSLTPSSSTAKVTGPSPPVTDANGQTTFTVTDTAAEAVTLTAVDTTDSVTVAQTASVTFQPPTVSGTHSTVTASPVSAGSTTITVTLRDQAANAQPLAGQTVTLAGTGSAVITPAATPNVTNASGVVTFTATDSADETVIFTATDTTMSTVIANTATVTFGTLTVSASQSTVTAVSPAPVGSLGTTVVVTLLSSTNSPVPGKVVSLQTSSGTAVIGTSNPAETGANGQVSFSLTDSVAESVTVTATDTTDSIALTSTPTVIFTTGGSPSATTSTVTAQATTSPADGQTQTLITVTLNDQFGNPVSGATITLHGAPPGNVETHPIAVGSSMPGVTNSSGVAEFEASDSHVESVTFTATDTTDNLVLAQTASISFQTGPADPTAQGSTVTAAPANPPADGSTPSTVTVTLTDFFSNPVAGKTIGLTALNGKSVITGVNAVTNQAGQATFHVTDSTAEVVTYQATDITDGNAVFTAEAVVTFGSPPAPPAVAADCAVVANPSSVPADGTHTATISVLLYDGNGDPVTGKTVTLTPSGGGSTVAATNATTNSSGMATFTVSDSTAQKVTYTADDTSDSVNLTSLPVTVTFTAASATTTTPTTTTTTTTTAASGATTTTTTTTTAASGVSLSSTSSGSSNTGNTGATSSSLADTGPSALLQWLIGLGALFITVGTIGRRRMKGERHEV